MKVLTMPSEYEVRVRTIRHEAEDVLSLELAAYGANALPAATAGAHIDLHLPNGLVRSYSLLDASGATSTYRIAVYRDPRTRGGSQYVHEALRPGELLRISAPRNHFELAEDAANSLFIAGGIGVTPFCAMALRLNALDRPWTLIYCAQTRERAAFLSELEALAAVSRGTLVTNFDGEPGGALLDIAAVIGAAPAETHFYCCGPEGMLTAYRKAAAGVPGERVHFEYFAADTDTATEGGFDVVLARSGQRVNVPPGNTILGALQAAGLSLPFSCQQGICGACETAVVAGRPDHRDMLLSDAERAAGKTMMICCSGALSDELVLDL
jgi:vanillate O-demethylase ferredoxin subunit